MHETKFNYTIDHTASPAADDLRGPVAAAAGLDDLQQKLKYDRLGVNDALRQFEDDLGSARCLSRSGSCRCWIAWPPIARVWTWLASEPERWRSEYGLPKPLNEVSQMVELMFAASGNGPRELSRREKRIPE